MKQPVVWIIKEQLLRGEHAAMPMDYTPALQFGNIEFVTRNDMPMYGKSQVQEMWNVDVLEFVSKYDEFTDFIICTGQPTAIFGVGYALGKVGKAPRFLVWRREENRYRVVNFDREFTVSVVTQ